MILDSIKIKNFKAVRDSGVVKLGALTALVGNNGSGKSSLIEALETYQTILTDGLDVAMQRWLGIEYVRHLGAPAKLRAGKALNAIEFLFSIGASSAQSTRIQMSINNDPAANQIYIAHESAKHKNGWMIEKELSSDDADRRAGISILSTTRIAGYKRIAEYVRQWQFMSLQPEKMGQPVPQQRTKGRIKLARDGQNIADYLLEIQRLNPSAFEGIVRTMSYVLPYAKDLQASLSTEIERKTYLQLSESTFKVPGWMLSTGTLRILAILAVLRHPEPPSLLVIEEIENGLDPRSIHLLVEEIRTAVQSGRTQVILTTHSPYLLDLLKLEHLVLVARNEAGEPKFHRPANDANLQEWAKEFAPGRLYTMGSLHGAVE